MLSNLALSLASLRRHSSSRKLGRAGVGTELASSDKTLADYLRKIKGSNCILYPSGLEFCPVQLPPEEAQRYRATGLRREAPLIRPQRSDRLSVYFPASAFWAKEPGCDCLRAARDLMIKLDLIVERLPGRVIQILSGYQLAPAPGSLDGVVDSVHQDGLAADIFCADVSLECLYEIASEEIGDAGAVFLYTDRFVHVDVAGKRKRGIIRFD